MPSATSPSGAQGYLQLLHPRGSRGDVAPQPPAPPAEGFAIPITLRHVQHCSPSSSHCVFVLSEAAPAPVTTENSHQVRFAFCSHRKPSQIPGLPTTSPSTPVSSVHCLHLCPLPQVICWSLYGPITAPGSTLGGWTWVCSSKQGVWWDHASSCLPRCHYLEVVTLGSNEWPFPWTCVVVLWWQRPHRDAH